MDRKSLIVLVVCFVILLLWYPVVVNKLLYPRKALPPSTNAPTAGVVSTNPTAVTTAATPTNLPTPATSPLLSINTNLPEQLIEIENDNARYTFSSHGGGLKTVEMKRYLLSVPTWREKRKQANPTKQLARLNSFSRAPTLALFGGEALQSDGIFTLSTITNGVRAEKTLSNGLTIIKDFELSTNYLVNATVRLENRSEQPLALPAQEWFVGTATPMSPSDKGDAVGVQWYNGSKADHIAEPWFANRFLGCFPGTPRTEYRAGASNVVWVAPHNQFFTLIAMPSQPGQEVVTRMIDLPRPAPEDGGVTNRPAPKGYETALVYPPLLLQTNQSVQRQIYLFAGPKEYRTLARIASRFNNNADIAMGFDRAFGGRFVAFFAKLLLLAMNTLHDIFKVGYGWVIIIITVIIKVLFWPLTQASTRSMKRMQAMQPQMNALREKYKDDPVKMNRKVMEFMRENKLNPLGGCLPMLLQMPVFIGFYVMIQSAIELRGERFLWVPDLTLSDTLFVLPGLGFIPILGIPGVGLPFNLLPLLMGATMLWQAHLTPPSPGMDPMQQKIMRYMPLMFMLILYNFSAGLTLYWTVQNLLTIAQTKLTRTDPKTAVAPPPAKSPVLTPPQKKKK
jgi:YidC/Oxa1 family membrane protein insertase